MAKFRECYKQAQGKQQQEIISPNLERIKSRDEAGRILEESMQIDKSYLPTTQPVPQRREQRWRRLHALCTTQLLIYYSYLSHCHPIQCSLSGNPERNQKKGALSRNGSCECTPTPLCTTECSCDFVRPFQEHSKVMCAQQQDTTKGTTGLS